MKFADFVDNLQLTGCLDSVHVLLQASDGSLVEPKIEVLSAQQNPFTDEITPCRKITDGQLVIVVKPLSTGGQVLPSSKAKATQLPIAAHGGTPLDKSFFKQLDPKQDIPPGTAAAAETRQKCPKCGAEEVAWMSPRTRYACGSSDYDQREGTFEQSETCKQAADPQPTTATPRTDAEVANRAPYQSVPADFARTLERELVEAKTNDIREIDTINKALLSRDATIAKLTEENKQARSYHHHECREFTGEGRCNCWILSVGFGNAERYATKVRELTEQLTTERQAREEAESKRKETAKDFELAFRVVREENDELSRLRTETLDRYLTNETKKIIDSLSRDNSALREALEKSMSVAEMLMTVVCNSSGGNWEKESPDWQTAARRWVDEYYVVLTIVKALSSTQPSKWVRKDESDTARLDDVAKYKLTITWNSLHEGFIVQRREQVVGNIGKGELRAAIDAARAELGQEEGK